MNHYDLAIVGGGPAGYTAALYGARSGLNTVVLEKICAGGQMVLTDRIENYPGFPAGIDGYHLGGNMRTAAEKAGAKTVFTEAKAITRRAQAWELMTDGGKLSADAVIIAAGAEPRKLGIPGEEKFIGKGVSYCAACDGMFYKGKDAAVIGGGNSAATEALHLARICRKVFLIHRRSQLRADAAQQKQLRQTENLELILNTAVTRLHGEEALEGVTLLNSETGEENFLRCDGVFAAIGRVPSSAPFSNVVPLDTQGFIITDDSLSAAPGVFAAGDIRQKQVRQIVTAAADGAVAAEAAAEYLCTLKS